MVQSFTDDQIIKHDESQEKINRDLKIDEVYKTGSA